MDDSVKSRAEQALRDLLDVSPQVEVALVATTGGEVLASSLDARPGGPERASKLGAVAGRIVEQAERARTELGREPVVQCEVATGDGNVFIVADDAHLVAAVTGNEPTVGLVFYDLKTALRTVREQPAASAVAASNGNGGSRRSKKSGKGAEA